MTKSKRIRRTRQKDNEFFEILAKNRAVQEALDATGYKRTSVYEWRREDPEFAQRWNEAIDQAIEVMETEADRRGVEGVLEPVFYQGEEVGYVRRYSDTLLIFRLKALAPDKYRERISQELTGKDGGPVEVKTLGELWQASGDGNGDTD